MRDHRRNWNGDDCVAWPWSSRDTRSTRWRGASAATPVRCCAGAATRRNYPLLCPDYCIIYADVKKRRRDDRQPISAALAAKLAPWLCPKAAGKPIFAMPPRFHVADRLRSDLADGGVSTADIDFHCLRAGFITCLVRSGANVKTCQELARHSTLALTIGTYARMSLNDQDNTLVALPTGCRQPTGTAGAAGNRHGHLDALAAAANGPHR